MIHSVRSGSLGVGITLMRVAIALIPWSARVIPLIHCSQVSPLIRSSGSSLGRGGLRSRGIIPIGEMNLFSQIFFVVQLGICMNSCCQSQLEYTLSDGLVRKTTQKSVV
jgi:hypothetical protein